MTRVLGPVLMSLCFAPQFFSYTMSVLFPEVLVRLIADFHNVGFDEVSNSLHFNPYM